VSHTEHSGPIPGWRVTTLGECAEFINGRRAYSQDELLETGTPVLRIQNLNGGDRWYYSDIQRPDGKYCEAGDLLFAWSASFGPYVWRGPKSIFHYHIWRVIPGPDLCREFAFHLLARLTRELKDTARGIAMLHLTKSGMEAKKIMLPPLAEQKQQMESIKHKKGVRRELNFYQREVYRWKVSSHDVDYVDDDEFPRISKRYRALKRAGLFGGTTGGPFVSGQSPDGAAPLLIQGYSGHVLYIGQKWQ
jgi:hypothetical protein